MGYHKENIRDYLDPENRKIYLTNLWYNIEVFEPDKYGDEAIKQESKIIPFRFDEGSKLINFDLQSYVLNDQTGIL